MTRCESCGGQAPDDVVDENGICDICREADTDERSRQPQFFHDGQAFTSDKRGVAAVIKDFADMVPTDDVKGERFTRPIQAVNGVLTRDADGRLMLIRDDDET